MGEIKKWRRGRIGFCDGIKGKKHTILICPDILNMIKEYKNEHGITTSLIINKAVEFYIKNIK